MSDLDVVKSGNSTVGAMVGSGLDVMEGVVVVECCFASYDEFITEYKTYRFDECSNCNGSCELVETDLTCTIEGRILHFSPILVLRCKKMWK